MTPGYGTPAEMHWSVSAGIQKQTVSYDTAMIINPDYTPVKQNRTELQKP